MTRVPAIVLLLAFPALAPLALAADSAAKTEAVPAETDAGDDLERQADLAGIWVETK